MSTLNESRPFIPVGLAVLTVSDTRTPADDRSGDTLVARISAAGYRFVVRRMTARILIRSGIKVFACGYRISRTPAGCCGYFSLSSSVCGSNAWA